MRMWGEIPRRRYRYFRRDEGREYSPRSFYLTNYLHTAPQVSGLDHTSHFRLRLNISTRPALVEWQTCWAREKSGPSSRTNLSRPSSVPDGHLLNRGRRLHFCGSLLRWRACFQIAMIARKLPKSSRFEARISSREI